MNSGVTVWLMFDKNARKCTSLFEVVNMNLIMSDLTSVLDGISSVCICLNIPSYNPVNFGVLLATPELLPSGTNGYFCKL